MATGCPVFIFGQGNDSNGTYHNLPDGNAGILTIANDITQTSDGTIASSATKVLWYDSNMFTFTSSTCQLTLRKSVTLTIYLFGGSTSSNCKINVYKNSSLIGRWLDGNVREKYIPIIIAKDFSSGDTLKFEIAAQTGGTASSGSIIVFDI